MKKLLVALAMLFTINSLSAIEIGDKAINFTGTTVDGKKISLDQYKGKKAVWLVFWATWCPYCEKEIPALKELYEKGQGIRLSGVGTHHQNGVSETSIKFTVYKACVLLIHAALQWSDVAEKYLCPMALQHTVYLHNITPRMDIGLSSEELWTRSKASKRKLSHVHTWGCPVYVLDSKLQNNQKILKWAPCSQRSQ